MSDEECTSGQNVLVFRSPAHSLVLGVSERSPITGSTPIVNGQHHKSARGKELVHGVAVTVIVHVVPTRQHLSHGAPVGKNYRWVLFVVAGSYGAKKLSV